MTAVTEPLPFRLLVDEAMKLTRRHFRRMFLPVALPVALAQSLVPVAKSLAFSRGIFNPSPEPAAAIVGMLAFVAVALLAAGVLALGYGALLAAATDAQTGAEISMGRAWRTMFRPRVLGTMFLVTLSFLVGCALCILPGIFLAVLFSLAVPVMVAERIYGTTALARAAALVRENPGGQLSASPMLKVLLIMVIGYVLTTAVGLVIQMPLMIIQQVVMVRAAAEGGMTDPMELMSKMTLFQVPASFLNTLAMTAVQVYMAFAISLFYFDLRRRQEGSDLESAVREMAGREPAPPAAG